MSNNLRPGDLVKFNFWSSYLAPSATQNEDGNTNWYEIIPGDAGIVLQVEPTIQEIDYIVIVLFARTGKILKVHANQLKLQS